MTSGGGNLEAARSKDLDALLRGLPLTRLLDYGLPRTDALALHKPASTIEDWIDRALALAEERHAGARTALEQGDLAQAAQAFEWQAAILNAAQIAFNSDSPLKERLYRSSIEAWEHAGRLSGEYRSLAYQLDGRNLRAWLLPAHEPCGCVLVWGGLSGWGLSYLGIARAFARRGIATLLVELPGQGLARMQSGLLLDASSIEALHPLIDLAYSFAPQVAVMGNSFGGLIAARFASHFRSSISACCVNGAMPHIAVPDFRTPREQMLAAAGVAEKDLSGWLERLAFRPEQHKLHCPVLIIEGGADPLVPLGAQAAFLTDRANSKTLTWAEGEHTIYNFANDRNALVSAWFADTFRNT